MKSGRNLQKCGRNLQKLKRQQGAVIAVKALKGEARSLALSISEEELDAENGLETLIKELDKLYLKDKDTMGYECWKKFSTYVRSMDASILSYCAEFRRLRIEAKQYNIEISDTTFGYMLLDNSNFSEDQKVLVLSIALSQVKDDKGITPDFIQSALRRIDNTPSSNARSSNDIFESDFNEFPPENIDCQSLSVEEKDEISSKLADLFKHFLD